MCGIVGYVGKKKALPILIDGLSTLEYRGYDSAGVSYVLNDEIYTVKEQGKLENLKKEVDLNTDTFMGIGHTRWATHGKPSKNNAHPHTKGVITLVHNGIIENYKELKGMLGDYDFTSDTDSEVVAALIDKLYKETNDIKRVLRKIKEVLKGSYALGIMVKDDNHLYAIRKNSPLIVACNDDGYFIASDVPAILKYTNKYILLEADEIACLGDQLDIYNDDLQVIKKTELTFEGSYESACKNGYEHFMLKEIHEQPEVFSKTVSPLLEYGKESLDKLPDFSKYTKIEIVACGSAYHAGLIGKSLIEKYADIEVNVYVASEYRYGKTFHDKNTLVILVSQSGETADTLACLNKIREEGLDSLGIINVVGSAIARGSTNVIYTKAGCEIAVATTKAYSAQVALLSLIALKLSDIDDKEFINIINNVKNLPNIMEQVLNYDYESIAKKLYEHNDIYFIGRGIDYHIALEGSLKLKEISYIHSEAYPAGELKHGTIALIDNNTPVIAIATDENLIEKTMSNVKEVKARGAYVLGITSLDSHECDDVIVIPKVHELFTPLLTVIPLQLISYYIAKLRGCDIDKPKNLAKSVTVE